MSKLSKKMNNLSMSENKRKKNPRKMRKRLSISDGNGQSPLLLDGYRAKKEQTASTDNYSDTEDSGSKTKLFKSYSMKTKVGVVPFNPNKVNQDRAIMVPILPNSASAMFGVFDGHGMNGHDVSSYLTKQMPKWYSQHKNWTKQPQKSLTDSFSWLTENLGKSNINCTFSGTTAVVTIMDAASFYTANVGDSRTVLAREEKGGTLAAIALSFDQKPDNEQEKIRIEKKNGRVEPCKGPMGEYIGPHRVWLKHQEMPGLAMSRSFGDDVATSVGVHSEPEIITTKREKTDRFIVTASDGIWEFLSNEEVVGIVGKYKDAQKACRALCEEATKRWKQEEDVIDDITAVIIYL
eukprot:276440_1